MSNEFTSQERTRDEHLAWLKQRALAELEYGAFEAMSSVLSDLSKHPETNDPALTQVTMVELAQARAGNRDAAQVRQFLEGLV